MFKALQTAIGVLKLKLNKKMRGLVKVFAEQNPENAEDFAEVFPVAMEHLKTFNWNAQLSAMWMKLSDKTDRISHPEWMQLKSILLEKANNSPKKKLSQKEQLEVFVNFADMDRDPDLPADQIRKAYDSLKEQNFYAGKALEGASYEV